MEKSIGALWNKQAKNGSSYMTGNIEVNGAKINVVVFFNKKSKESQPDYQIYVSKPLEQKSLQNRQHIEELAAGFGGEVI